MKCRTGWLFIICILFIFTSCTTIFTPPEVKSTLSPAYSPNKYTKVAVYIDGNRNDKWRHIEEEFIKGLLSKFYSVPARSDLALILKEQNFQESSLTDKTAVKLGKMIDVEAIIVVTVSPYRKEKKREISARMIDIENGEIVWLGKTDSGRYNFAKARYLARSIPPSEYLGDIFKDENDYFKSDGMKVPGYNWMETNKIILQVKHIESKALTSQFEDEIISKLMENGFRVPNRGNLSSIIREHNFNANMLSDKALTQLGKISNATVMLVVWMNKVHKINPSNFSYYGPHSLGTVCTVRAIDLETSNIVWSGSSFYAHYGRIDEKYKMYEGLIKKVVNSGLIPEKK